MEVGRRWRARCFCGVTRVLVGSGAPATERGSLYGNCRAACALRVSRLAVVLPPSGRCACARGIYGVCPTRLVIFISRRAVADGLEQSVRVRLSSRAELEPKWHCAAVFVRSAKAVTHLDLYFDRCGRTALLAPTTVLAALLLQPSRRASDSRCRRRSTHITRPCCPGARCSLPAHRSAREISSLAGSRINGIAAPRNGSARRSAARSNARRPAWATTRACGASTGRRGSARRRASSRRRRSCAPCDA